MEQKKKYKLPAFNKLRECPICKEKKFVVDPSEYVYKIDHKYYCSWTCYRKAQKILEEQRTKKKANLINSR